MFFSQLEAASLHWSSGECLCGPAFFIPPPITYSANRTTLPPSHRWVDSAVFPTPSPLQVRATHSNKRVQNVMTHIKRAEVSVVHSTTVVRMPSPANLAFTDGGSKWSQNGSYKFLQCNQSIHSHLCKCKWNRSLTINFTFCQKLGIKTMKITTCNKVDTFSLHASCIFYETSFSFKCVTLFSPR